MFKNKLCIVIAFLAIAMLMLVAGIFLHSCLSQRNYLLIQDDGIYFGIRKNNLLAVKGIPTSIQKNVADTPFDEYIFEETIDGYISTCSYNFYHSRLNDISFVVTDIAYDEALTLSRDIMNRQQLHYSNYDGYFTTEGQIDDCIYLSHGVNTGHGGYLFEFEYSQKILTIRALMQD